ncbi:MAG TPA: Tim44-like domain-containing protein, partial [Polyangia bacterium]
DGDGGIGFIILIFELLFRYPKVGIPLLIITVVVIIVKLRASSSDEPFSTGAADSLSWEASAQAVSHAGGHYQVEVLRQADPDFSEPLFLDFVAALVARSVALVETPRLVEVDRYLTGRDVLLPFGAGSWKNVVVGSTQLRSVQTGPAGSRIVVEVALGATGAAGGCWWRTAWTFTRAAGVRSKGPGEITRLACPACGAGAERKEDGSCRYCDQQPAPGEAAWAALQVDILEEESRPPVSLGGYAEESGTDLPTVESRTLAQDLAALPQHLPDFEWEKTSERCRQVFLALQRAWSDRDLAALRSLTTDAVFTTWRYWIEAYRAAGLRNRLEKIQVKKIESARVSLDKYYAAVTVRIFASMVDQTVDDGGTVVDGQEKPRAFTEYWTFVRTLSAAKQEGVTCPGCGANLPAGQSGQCPYCSSMVGAPAFDWILSRIDQDEDYTGA